MIEGLHLCPRCQTWQHCVKPCPKSSGAAVRLPKGRHEYTKDNLGYCQREVLDYLEKHGEGTAVEIVSATDLRILQVRHALARLQDRRKVILGSDGKWRLMT